MFTLTTVLINCSEKDNIEDYNKNDLLGNWNSFELITHIDTTLNPTIFDSFVHTGISIGNDYYYFFSVNSQSVEQKWSLRSKTILLFDNDNNILYNLDVIKLSDEELWVKYFTSENNQRIIKFRKI